MLVPVKFAMTDVPDHDKTGASGFEKSILPVYRIFGSFAGIVTEA
jgi:hypothetical protein